MALNNQQKIIIPREQNKIFKTQISTVPEIVNSSMPCKENFELNLAKNLKPA